MSPFEIALTIAIIYWVIGMIAFAWLIFIADTGAPSAIEIAVRESWKTRPVASSILVMLTIFLMAPVWPNMIWDVVIRPSLGLDKDD
jgi:hypothetical protein